MWIHTTAIVAHSALSVVISNPTCDCAVRRAKNISTRSLLKNCKVSKHQTKMDFRVGVSGDCIGLTRYVEYINDLDLYIDVKGTKCYFGDRDPESCDQPTDRCYEDGYQYQCCGTCAQAIVPIPGNTPTIDYVPTISIQYY